MAPVVGDNVVEIVAVVVLVGAETGMEATVDGDADPVANADIVTPPTATHSFPGIQQEPPLPSGGVKQVPPPPHHPPPWQQPSSAPIQWLPQMFGVSPPQVGIFGALVVFPAAVKHVWPGMQQESPPPGTA